MRFLRSGRLTAHTGLLLGAGVLGALIAIGVTAGAAWLRYVAVLDRSRERLDTLSAVLAEHTERSVESLDVILEVVADRVEARARRNELSPEGYHELATAYLSGIRQARGLLILDRDGVAVGDSVAFPPRPFEGADRDFFRVHRDGIERGLFIGAPIQSRLTGLWTIPLSRRYERPDGSFGGVIVLSLEPAYFGAVYRSVAASNDERIGLHLLDGTLLVGHPFDDRAVGTMLQLDGRLAPGADPASLSAVASGSRFPLAIQVSANRERSLREWQGELAYIVPGGLAAALLVLAVALSLLGEARSRESSARALEQRRHEAEAARARAEKLAALAETARLRALDAERAKSQFLASMSHELRTPLNAIIGFSETLTLPVFGPLNARQREYIGHVHDAGEMLLSLIEQLLDSALVESGRLELHEGEVDVLAVLEGSRTLLAGRASRAGLELAVRADAGLPRLRGDALRIRQIVINLATNAVKFTPAGGRVTLEARSERDGGIAIVVADTGVGMTADALATATEAYRRGDNETTRSREGVGLGLAITKALVEAHGAALTFESAPGAGTTAIVRFPPHRLATPSAQVGAAA